MFWQKSFAYNYQVSPLFPPALFPTLGSLMSQDAWNFMRSRRTINSPCIIDLSYGLVHNNKGSYSLAKINSTGKCTTDRAKIGIGQYRIFGQKRPNIRPNIGLKRVHFSRNFSDILQKYFQRHRFEITNLMFSSLVSFSKWQELIFNL